MDNRFKDHLFNAKMKGEHKFNKKKLFYRIPRMIDTIRFFRIWLLEIIAII